MTANLFHRSEREFLQCPIPAGKWSASAANLHSSRAVHQLTGECMGMSIAQDRAQASSPSTSLNPLSTTAAADDPVSRGLHESARKMVGIALFSGVINLLMLSGSLYMLQVYDRVIPSRNIATLFGLSLMVLFAYLMQGYFDALRARMLCRVATLFDVGLQEFHPYRARHAAAPRRQANGDATAVARSRPDPRLHVEHGADRIPRHALDTDLSDRAVSVSSGDRHDRAARHRRDHRHDAADRAHVAQGGQGHDGLQRPKAGARRYDPAQCRDHPGARHGRSIRRALGARQRTLSA